MNSQEHIPNVKKSYQNYIRLNLLLIIYAFLNSTCYSQSYFFRHYQVDNGLSNNAIYCSIQDRNGFMWFGTRDGLNRFDGYHFKTYKVNNTGNSLVPDLIYCISGDKKERLWVGSSKGLYSFDYQKETLVSVIDSLKEINTIQVDSNNQIWFISDYTLYRYNIQNRKLTKFPPSDYFRASSISLDAKGQVWVGTKNGFLQRFNEETQTFKSYNVFSHSLKCSSLSIQKIYCSEASTVYVGTVNQGLKKFDIASGTYKDIMILNSAKTIIHVRDIKQYADNELWLATESGIFILNTITNQFTNLKKKFLDPFSLTDNAVYSLCKDNEGGIWAGTFFGGINYYSKKNSYFEKYFSDNSKKSLSGNVIREICPDHFGNIWIGTEDAGLNKLNPRTGTITQFIADGEKGSITYSNIQGLLNIGNDLWIGTFEHGLDIMDIKTGKIKKHFNAGQGKYDLKNNFITHIFQTKSGEIFIGTANSLVKYNPQMDGFEPVIEPMISHFTTSILEDSNGTIWFGTSMGVHYYNPLTKEKGYLLNNPKDLHSLTNNSVNTIFEDNNHCLWFATEGGGLCKLSKDRKTITSLTMKDGLPSNFVVKVLEDDKNTLWISTTRGLVNFNPVNNSIVNYTKDNGLLSDQFNYNSGYKDRNGRMYFGSIKGMITFDPKDILKEIVSAPIYITDFRVNNKEQKIGDEKSFLKKSIIYTNEITLPHDNSSFNIDFTTLSYTSPEMTIFSYFMEGLDKEWTEIKPNRTVYFTNLSSGEYVFKLKASINGNESKTEKKLTIIVLPPWWATIWAYIFYALMIATLVYYLLKTYLIIVEDKKEKEIYESKIDFFTNVAHEIRTPLTLIKGPVENLLEQIDNIPQIKEDVILMERNTERLIKLVSQILDFRKIETKGFIIDYTEVNITKLLQEEFHTFEDLAKRRKLKYTLDYGTKDVFAFIDEEALNKIFSNLFNNAIKYAHKKVSIRLLEPSDNSAFTIEFENDGLMIPPEMRVKIFEPFYRLKETLKQQGTGIGLSLTMSLTELLHGKIYVKDTDNGLNVFVLSLPFK